jgi:hypothetical protein
VFDGDNDTIAIIDIGAVEVQPAPEEPCPPGDYNDNATVDAADYVVWRKTLGTNFELPNEAPTETPGMVTEGDYDVWVENFAEVCTEDGGIATVDLDRNDIVAAANDSIETGTRMHKIGDITRSIEILTGVPRISSANSQNSTAEYRMQKRMTNDTVDRALAIFYGTMPDNVFERKNTSDDLQLLIPDKYYFAETGESGALTFRPNLSLVDSGFSSFAT